MSDIVKDTLVVDMFIKRLSEYADVQSQMGEHSRALMISQAAQVIQMLTYHCSSYNIGIPAQQILHIVRN